MMRISATPFATTMFHPVDNSPEGHESLGAGVPQGSQTLAATLAAALSRNGPRPSHLMDGAWP
jgi:hypothetical protein